MKLLVHLRTLLAFLLLIVFSLVNLPREFWHHGEHHSIHSSLHDNEGTHISLSQEDCPICALHITPLISPIYWDKLESVEIRLGHTPTFDSRQACSLSSTLRLRGPPLQPSSFWL